MIVMDYFFRCQKSSFNVENNKCLCQRNSFLYRVTGSTCSRVIFRAVFISRIYTKLWKELEKFNLYQSSQFCYIYKFLNFMEIFPKKELKLSKLEYYYFCGKVNFSVMHPTHITIYSFWRTMLSSKVFSCKKW